MGVLVLECVVACMYTHLHSLYHHLPHALQVIILTFVYFLLWLALSVVLSLIMALYLEMRVACDEDISPSECFTVIKGDSLYVLCACSLIKLQKSKWHRAACTVQMHNMAVFEFLVYFLRT